MRYERIGSTIGATFGVVFVSVNAGAFAAPWDSIVRVLGVTAFAATIWFGVVRAPRGREGELGARAKRTYGVAVLAEVTAILVGALVFNELGLPQLVLPWVVIVVGLHFLPFATAFAAPVFKSLAWILVFVGLIGCTATALVADIAGPVTGVVAGLVLLAFSAYGARGHEPARSRTE